MSDTDTATAFTVTSAFREREPEPVVRALGIVLGGLADLDEDESVRVLLAVAALYELPIRRRISDE